MNCWRKSLPLVTTATLALAAVQAPAAWVLVDDFEGSTSGASIAGQIADNGETWNLDQGGDATFQTTAVSTNTVLDYVAGNDQVTTSVALSSSATPLPDGGLGTLFFRFQLPSSDDSAKFAVGVSDESPATNSNSHKTTELQFDGGDGVNDPTLLIRNGGGYTSAITLENDVWYNAWLSLDLDASGGKGYSVFLEGGSYASPTLLTPNGDSFFGFRDYNGGGIDTFYAKGFNSTKASLSVDDIYFNDATESIVNPIPEPASLALLGLGGLLVAGRGRWTA